jgi:hypothetical protein
LASVAVEQPELPELPAEGRLAEGVAGDRAVLLDRLFITGNGLGGKNPNTVYSPQNRIGQVQLIEEDEASRPDPTYDLLPTVPGR